MHLSIKSDRGVSLSEPWQHRGKQRVWPGEDSLSPSKAKPRGMGSGNSPTVGKGDSFCSQQQAHEGAYVLGAAEGTVLNSHPVKKVPGTPRNVSWRCQHITKCGCLAHK